MDCIYFLSKYKTYVVRYWYQSETTNVYCVRSVLRFRFRVPNFDLKQFITYIGGRVDGKWRVLCLGTLEVSRFFFLISPNHFDYRERKNCEKKSRNTPSGHEPCTTVQCTVRRVLRQGSDIELKTVNSRHQVSRSRSWCACNSCRGAAALSTGVRFCHKVSGSAK